jgi:hypothetical protein
MTTTPPPAELLECYETGCETGGQCIPGLVCQGNRCVNPAFPNSPTCKPEGSVTPTTTLPPTALISDTADRILLGAIALMIGFWIYLSGFYKVIGDHLWYKAAHPFLKNVWNEYRSRTFESDILNLPEKSSKAAKAKRSAKKRK